MGRKAKFSRGQVEELSQSRAGSVKKTVPPEPSKPTEPADDTEPKERKKRRAFSLPKPKWKRRSTAPEVTLEQGQPSVMDLICPASVDLTARDRLEMDGVCHAYLYVAGYGYQTLVGNGWLSALGGDGVSVSFTLRRQQRDKILPKVVQSTMWSRSRMREIGDTRSDYEELGSAIAAGAYLKEGMNRYNEDFYFMYTLIEVTADDPALLEQRVADVERLCVSQDMVCKRCDYQQGEAFCSFLPVVKLHPDIERKARRNVLTMSAASAFPFSSYDIFDETGIFLGINQHTGNVCMVDVFDSSKYSNGNISIMGMSGAGKTYLLQLVAMRYRQQNVPTFIIAPLKGHEYRIACEAIGGKYIKLSPSSGDCINILEIRRTALNPEGESKDSLLADKISQIHIFYSLLMPEMTVEQRNLLDVSLVECYARFGINYDNESIVWADGKMKPMPILKDLYDVLIEREESKPLALVLTRFVSGSAHQLGGQTNVQLSNKYTVIDISEIGKDLLPLGMFLATSFCWDRCKQDRSERKIMILDELWSLIGAGSNMLAADFVLEIFKIIRGYGGIAIGATQDLSDYFALEDGRYGRGIINACRLKIALPTEENEAHYIKDSLGLTDEEFDSYRGFERGQALLCAGKTRIGVNVHASKKEHDLITTDRRDLERMRHRATLEKLGKGDEAHATETAGIT